jgi:hypothetical protein
LARKRKKSRAKKKAAAEKRVAAEVSSPPDIDAEDSVAAAPEEAGAAESAKKSSAKKSSAKKGSAKKWSAKKSSAKKGPTRKSSAKKGSAKEGSAKEPPQKKESAKALRHRSPRVNAPELGDPTEEPVAEGESVGKESVLAVDENVDEVSLDEDAEEFDAAALIAATAALAEPVSDPAASVVTDTADVFDISLDADDEETDRERLIAEALAFVEQEEAGDPHGSPASPGVIGVAGPESQDVESSDIAALAEGRRDGAEVDESAESEGVPPGEGPEASEDVGDNGSDEHSSPRMTAAAYNALSAFHTEGLARVPDEIILDLGEATTDEQRDRLLAAALAHVDMQDAVYRVRSTSGLSRSRLKATSTYVILVIALIVAIIPPGFIVPSRPTQVTNADREYGLRVAMVLEAQQIEAFRVETQRLPNSLDEVTTGLPGIRFVKSSARLYQLIAYLPSGEAIVYDSAAPSVDFQRIARVWAPSSPGL